MQKYFDKHIKIIIDKFFDVDIISQDMRKYEYCDLVTKLNADIYKARDTYLYMTKSPLDLHIHEKYIYLKVKRMKDDYLEWIKKYYDYMRDPHNLKEEKIELRDKNLKYVGYVLLIIDRLEIYFNKSVHYYSFICEIRHEKNYNINAHII